jgi:hypothetical protein
VKYGNIAGFSAEEWDDLACFIENSYQQWGRRSRESR